MNNQGTQEPQNALSGEVGSQRLLEELRALIDERDEYRRLAHTVVATLTHPKNAEHLPPSLNKMAEGWAQWEREIHRKHTPSAVACPFCESVLDHLMSDCLDPSNASREGRGPTENSTEGKDDGN